MRIIVAIEGDKINWGYDTNDFLTFPENRRIGLSVRFLERLAEKIRAFGIFADDPVDHHFPTVYGQAIKKYSLIWVKRRYELVCIAKMAALQTRLKLYGGLQSYPRFVLIAATRDQAILHIVVCIHNSIGLQLGDRI